MTNLFTEALPELSIEPEFPSSSRIDVIGQNGNDGLHYEPTSFAIQTIFQYGWDFVGYDDEDGLRQTFNTKEEALKELVEIIEATQDDPIDWQIVPYNPNEDDCFARF